MPISHVIVDDIVLVTVADEAHLADVRAYLMCLRADPAYHEGLTTLVDCRRVKTLLSTADLRTIAAEMKGARPASVQPRTAMLAGSDVVFGLLRMYEAFTDGSTAEVRVFRDEHEAYAWLRRADIR